MADFLIMAGLVHAVAGLVLVLLVAGIVRWGPMTNARTRHDLWLAGLLLILAMPLLVLLPPAGNGSVDLPPAAPSTTGAASGLPALDGATAPRAAAASTPGREGVAAAIALVPPAPWLDVALLALWVVGAGIGVVRLALAWRRSRLLYEHSRPAPAAAHATLRDLAGRIGLRRVPELRCGRDLRAPMTAGIRHPWIALPEAWLATGRSELLEHALAHELAHVLRRDPLASLLQRLAAALFFYHPGVLYACHRVEEERESACDDWAIRHTGGTRRYAESLLVVAEALVTRVNPVLAVGCLRSKSQLTRRITHMLDRNRNHSTRTRWPLVGATALAATVALFSTRAAWPDPPRLAHELRAAASVITTGIHPDQLAVHEDEGLLHAAWLGDEAAARALLDAGADPNELHRRRGSPRTALVAAAGQGHEALVTLLLERGADPDLAARGDGTPLIAAVRSGHDAIARRLLEAGADADARREKDGSPLISAAGRGNAPLVRELLARGAVADAAVPGDGSPLIAAARAGDVETVELLIAAGADPERYVPGDEAPLYHAVVNGHAPVVEVLLAAGADPDVRYDGDGTPLMLALRHGHDDVARLLTAAGVDLDRSVRGDGNALIEAVRRDDPATVERLLGLGADPNATVRGDGSALINAAARGREDLVALLLASGADVNLAVRGDDTPLINAVRSGSERVVTMLIEAGADVDQPGDKDGWLDARRTPLNQADDEAIIELLTAAGARR